jgi:hypothetical protein
MYSLAPDALESAAAAPESEDDADEDEAELELPPELQPARPIANAMPSAEPAPFTNAFLVMFLSFEAVMAPTIPCRPYLLGCQLRARGLLRALSALCRLLSGWVPSSRPP